MLSSTECRSGHMWMECRLEIYECRVENLLWDDYSKLEIVKDCQGIEGRREGKRAKDSSLGNTWVKVWEEGKCQVRTGTELFPRSCGGRGFYNEKKKKKESALACWRDVQSQTLKNDLSDLKCLLVVSAEQWQRTIWGKEFIKKQEFEHVSREVLGFGERVKLVTWFGWYKSPWVSDTSTTRNGRELFLGEHECLKAELLQRPLDLEA